MQRDKSGWKRYVKLANWLVECVLKLKVAEAARMNECCEYYTKHCEENNKMKKIILQGSVCTVVALKKIQNNDI